MNPIHDKNRRKVHGRQTQDYLNAARDRDAVIIERQRFAAIVEEFMHHDSEDLANGDGSVSDHLIDGSNRIFFDARCLKCSILARITSL